MIQRGECYLWERILPPIFISCDFCFLSVVPAPDRAVSDRGIGSNFPVFGLMIEPLFRNSCRWKSVHFSVSSVPDILLLAYQHSILLSLSLPAQVHALRKKADMLFMPDALKLVVRMYCSSSLR